MCAVYATDRAFTVLYKLELSIPVNESKAAKRLRKIMKEIPPGFDIIVRIAAEKFSAIWQSFNFCLRLCKADLRALLFGSRREGFCLTLLF